MKQDYIILSHILQSVEIICSQQLNNRRVYKVMTVWSLHAGWFYFNVTLRKCSFPPHIINSVNEWDKH